MGAYDPARPLDGRAIIVTGAAGCGVGAGVCAAVHAAGGRLVINDLDGAAVRRVAELYPGAVAVPADVSDPAGAARLVEVAYAECQQVSGLVNNAGVGLSRPFHEASEDEFDRVFSIDVRGLWLVSRAFARHVLARGTNGAIVHVSSVHARATMSRYAVYASAKAAVESLARGMAVELGRHEVRCNAIAPGYVHSEQGFDLIRTFTREPEAWVNRHTRIEQVLPRLIDPLDCGWAAVFLLSEASRCITGQTLAVDAGLTARLYNNAIQEDSLDNGEDE